MTLNKIRLGDYIEQVEDKNTDLKFGIDDVKGVSIKKVFIETKADMRNVSLKPYLIVKPNSFCYVPVTSRNGEKITITLNMTTNTYIVSSSYVVFKIKDEKIIHPKYLFMIFNRSEFDRYSRFNSWGSAREVFSYDEMCNMLIDLPPYSIQKKYVAIYEGLLANLHSYEKGLDDLKIVCDGYIEELRRNSELKRVGDYINFRNEKNKDNLISLEQGININKEFITPQRGNSNLSNRKIVRKGDIAYCTQLNNENVAIAYREDEDCVVSAVYDSLYVKDLSELNPKYLFLWFCRSEFGRFVYWKSTGTSYEFLDGENIEEMLIPIPDITVQNAIVEISNSMNKRKSYIDNLKRKISNICPILIKGSIEEAQRS